MNNKTRRSVLLIFVALLMVLQPVAMTASAANFIEPSVSSGEENAAPGNGTELTVPAVEPDVPKEKPKAPEGAVPSKAKKTEEETKSEVLPAKEEPAAAEESEAPEAPASNSAEEVLPATEKKGEVLPALPAAEKKPVEEKANLFLKYRGDLTENMLSNGKVLVTRDGEEVASAPVDPRGLEVRDLLKACYKVVLSYETITGETVKKSIDADLRAKDKNDFHLVLSTDLLVTEDKDEVIVNPLEKTVDLPAVSPDDEKVPLLVKASLEGNDLVLRAEEKKPLLGEPFYMILGQSGDTAEKVTALEEGTNGRSGEFRIPLYKIKNNTYRLSFSKVDFNTLTDPQLVTALDIKVQKRENPEKVPKTSNLVLRFAGELKEKYLPSAKVVLKRDGQEVFSTGIKDLSPLTVEGLQRDRYDVEFSYVNNAGTVVKSNTTVDLRGDRPEVEDWIATKLFVEGEDEYYVSPLRRKNIPITDESGNVLALLDLTTQRKDDGLSLVFTEKKTGGERGFTIKEVAEDGQVLQDVRSGLDFRKDRPEDPHHGEILLPLEKGLKTLVLEKDGGKGKVVLSLNYLKGKKDRALGDPGSEEGNLLEQWKKDQGDLGKDSKLKALYDKPEGNSSEEPCKSCIAPGEDEALRTFTSSVNMERALGGPGTQWEAENTSTTGATSIYSVSGLTVTETDDGLKWEFQFSSSYYNGKVFFGVGDVGGSTVSISRVSVTTSQRTSDLPRLINGIYFERHLAILSSNFMPTTGTITVYTQGKPDTASLNLRLGHYQHVNDPKNHGGELRVNFTATKPAPAANGNVIVRVGDPSQDPVEADVTLQNYNGVFLRERVNGVYTFRGLEEGMYTISIDVPPGYQLSPSTPNNQSVSVGSAGDTYVNFTLIKDQPTPPVEDTGYIIVRMEDNTGQPLAGLVEIRKDGRLVDTLQGSGTSKALPVGNYTVTATAPQGYTLTSGSNPVEAYVMRDGNTRVNFFFTPQARGSITVTANDEDGFPIPAPITITGPKNGSFTGSGTLRDLPPGQYTVTATAPDGYRLKSPGSNSQAVTITGGSDKSVTFIFENDTTPVPPPVPVESDWYVPVDGKKTYGTDAYSIENVSVREENGKLVWEFDFVTDAYSPYRYGMYFLLQRNISGKYHSSYEEITKAEILKNGRVIPLPSGTGWKSGNTVDYFSDFSTPASQGTRTRIRLYSGISAGDSTNIKMKLGNYTGSSSNLNWVIGSADYLTAELTAKRGANGTITISMPGHRGTGTFDLQKDGLPWKTMTIVDGGPTEPIVLPSRSSPYAITLSRVPAGYRLADSVSPTQYATVMVGLNTPLSYEVTTTSGAKMWKVEVLDASTKAPIPNPTVSVSTLAGDPRGTDTGNDEGIATIYSGEFVNGETYKIDASAPGYVPKEFQYPYNPGETVQVELERSVSEQRTLRVKAMGTDNRLLPGTKISLVDDSGRTITSVANNSGLLDFVGMFTPKKTYRVKVLAVPDGYYLPEESQDTTFVFNPMVLNPSVSTMNKIIIQKIDTNPGELKIKTNVTEGPVKIEIYRGKSATGIPMHRDKVINAGQTIKLPNFEKNQYYTVKILEAPDGYPVGSTSTFQFNPRKPNLDIFLKKVPFSDMRNKFIIKIHEEHMLGPMTTKMEGRTIQFFRRSAPSSRISGVIQDGTAKIPASPGVAYELDRNSLQLPPGYKLVTDSDELRLHAYNDYIIKDWVLVKNTATLHLKVLPPIGKTLPSNMTFNLVEVSGSGSKVVRENIAIQSGETLVEGLEQGKTYNIKYNSATVPEGWTHSGALTVPFQVAQDETDTFVQDQFGYKDPRAKYSIWTMEVVDNAGSPVSGYEFILRKDGAVVNDEEGHPVKLVTGEDGRAFHKFPMKLPPGIYTVENTKQRPGYTPVKLAPVTITSDKFNIEGKATVGVMTTGSSYVDVRLLDPSGQPLAGKEIQLFEVSSDGSEKELTDYTNPVASLRRRMITDGEGWTYFKPLPVKVGRTYKFKLRDQSSPYELYYTSENPENHVFKAGESYQVILRTRGRSGFGQIKVVVKDDKGQPVSTEFQIKKLENGRETLVDLYPGKFFPNDPGNTRRYTGYTDMGGTFTTELLANGRYKVILKANDKVWEVPATTGKEKVVTIPGPGGETTVLAEFTGLKKRLYEIKGPAGKIEVSGQITESKSTWKVTVTKFSNTQAPGNPLSRRGVRNSIRFPASQLINPTNVRLRIINRTTGAVTNDAKIDGNFVYDGTNYQLFDDRSSDKNRDEMVYEYTFDAIPVPDQQPSPNAYDGYVRDQNTVKKGKVPYRNFANVPMDPEVQSPGYSIIGETTIVSSAANETIFPVDAGMKLEAKDTNVNMTITGNGVVDTDMTIHWNYDIETDISRNAIPGDFKVKIAIPRSDENFQNPLDENTVVRLFEKDGPEVTTAERQFDPVTKSWYVKIPGERGKKKKYVLKVDTFANHKNLPGDYYRQEVSGGFYRPTDPLDAPLKALQPFTATAPRRELPPGVVKEELSRGSCDKFKTFRIYQEGTMAADGSRIFWTIRATNVAASPGFDALSFHKTTFPLDMIFQKGPGLGNIENVRINANATGFPYIDDSSFANPMDNEDSTIPGNLKVVLANRKVPGGRAHPLDINYHVFHEGYNRKWANHKAYLLKRMPYLVKKNTSLIDSGFYKDNNDKDKKSFDPNFQRVNRGDFVEVSFETPVENYFQAAKGYTITTTLNTYDYGFDFRDYSGRRHTCRPNPYTITLKDTPFVGSSVPCVMKSSLGEATLRGQYTSDGSGIQWQLDVQPLKGDNFDLHPKRRFNITLNFEKPGADGNYSPAKNLGEVGLIDPKGQFKGTFKGVSQSVSADENRVTHTFNLSFGAMEDHASYTFTTPFSEDLKEDYRVSITGAVSDDNSNTPLKTRNGSNKCYAIVQGRAQKIKVQKKWTNFLPGQKLPPTTFEVYRGDVHGNTKKMTVFSIGEQRYDESSHSYPEYEVRKEGKYNVAQGTFELPNGLKSPGSKDYYYFETFDEQGQPYTYSVNEVSDPTYKSEMFPLKYDNSLVLINNIMDLKFAQQDDPTTYTDPTKDPMGKYPEDYRQEGPDIRNAKTSLDGTVLDEHKKPLSGNIGEPFKVQYEDSKVGKSGQQTNTPGLFDMKLTMEGLGTGGARGGVDVVFVMDNSGTMSFPIGQGGGNSGNYSKIKTYKLAHNRKIDNMREEVTSAIDTLLALNTSSDPNFVKVGLVNFATDVLPVDNPTPIGDGQFRGHMKQAGELIYARPVTPLTNNRQELQPGIPVDPRSVDNAFTNGSYWLPKTVAGQTNVQAGIREGVKLLHPQETVKRKKVLVVMTDGAPSAHFRMTDSRNPTKDTNVVSNATYWFVPKGSSPISYYTRDGLYIDNNGTPTIKEMDYWKRQYPDMEVYTLALDPQAANDLATPEEQINFLKQITSNPETDHFNVGGRDEFHEAMAKINTKVTETSMKTILGGEVTDPMGDMVNFRDINKDGEVTLANLAPGSSPDGTGNFELTDGDVHLYDNKGTYLDAQGHIHSRTGYKQAMKLFRDVEVRDRRYGGSVIKRVDVLVAGRNGIWYYREKDADWQTIAPYGGKYLLEPYSKVLDNAIPNEQIERVAERGNLYLAPPSSTFIDNIAPYREAFNGYLEPNVDTLLYGVNVRGTKNGNTITGFKVTGLVEGTEDMVTALYKINLKTENPGFQGNFYYQANKETILRPRPFSKDPEDAKIKRFFPIPSVKGPHKPLSIRKVWVQDITLHVGDEDRKYKVKYTYDDGGNLVYAFVDDNARVLPDPPYVSPATDGKIKRLLNGNIKDLRASFTLYQMKSREPYNASQDPPSTPNVDEKKVYSTFTLDAGNKFKVNFDRLLAYDNEGYEYFYQVDENMTDLTKGWELIRITDKFKAPKDGTGTGSIGDEHDVHVTDVPSGTKEPPARPVVWDTLKYSYTKEEGSRFTGALGPYQTLDNVTPVTEFSNRKTTEDIGFYLKKVERDPKLTAGEEKTLEGVEFTLTKVRGIDGREIVPHQVVKKEVTDIGGLIKFDKLKEGYYTLQETKGLPGYVLDDTIYNVRVIRDPNDDDSILGYKVGGGTLKIAIYKGDNLNEETWIRRVDEGELVTSLPVLEVDNVKVNLPDTGGLGFTPGSVLVGLALLVVCAYIFKVNKEDEYEM